MRCARLAVDAMVCALEKSCLKPYKRRQISMKHKRKADSSRSSSSIYNAPSGVSPGTMVTETIESRYTVVISILAKYLEEKFPGSDQFQIIVRLRLVSFQPVLSLVDQNTNYYTYTLGAG
jgi:hypothetical protein